MVFARYIAFVLSTYLGKFIKGLNKNSVNISVLKGSFELKNVELSPDILTFSEHLQLESGTIGSLSVNIPWRALYSRRCEVVIRDVAIVVAPKYCQRASGTSFFKSEEEFLAAVQAVLAGESREETTEKESKHGFLYRLTQTILKNLAFRLENVSFQLEDKSGFWQGCSAGVKAQIGRLSCEATDATFNPVFIQPEDQDTAVLSLYRLITYENVTAHLLYAEAIVDVLESKSSVPHNFSSNGNNPPVQFTQLENVLSSSHGVLTVAYEDFQAINATKPSLGLTLVVSEGGSSWSSQSVAALGVLFESLRCAPQRAYAWSMRPEQRPRQGNVGDVMKWWQYAIKKTIECQKGTRRRSRFSWKMFVQRKIFISEFLYYCLLLLKAPWLPEGIAPKIDQEQLMQTPMHEVMTCWNAARWLVKQYESTKKPPEGTFYSQFLHYYCLHAKSAGENEKQSSKLPFDWVNIDLTAECVSLTSKLDDDLETKVSNLLMVVSKNEHNLLAQLSVSSVAIFAQGAEDAFLLSINGGDTAALLTVSQTDSAPIGGQLSVGSISTCLDFVFQELLISKVVSYIEAVKPFTYQCLMKPSKQKQAGIRDPPKPRNLLGDKSFSQFTLTVKSVIASADGVSLGVQNIGCAHAPHDPVVVKVQEIAVTVNNESLLQLHSIEITPTLSREGAAVEVLTDTASLSTKIDNFEYVNLLISATAQRWKKEAGYAVAETPSFFTSVTETKVAKMNSSKSSNSGSASTKISVHFGFIECGALALDTFVIQATLSDGWYVHLSAAGVTTEGWCHSAPPHPQDPFMVIDMWADAYLQESPFAGSIEDNGIGFVFTVNHVTLCLGDELAATMEALFDIVMLLIFDNEDRHVHLRNEHLYNIPHISGRLVGSDAKILLESDGGDLTLLPGYAAAVKEEASRNAFFIPVPSMPLTVELPGKDCLDLTVHRFGDKRMDIAVNLRSGVNVFLRGTPTHVPLLPLRDGARAEIELHLSAPSEADLRVFPYSRVNVAMRLSDFAVVAHIPTVMALWTNFNTPSLPLARIRNVGNRIHFASRPNRPGKTLAPRSPVSAVVEAIGATALERSSPFEKAAAQNGEAAAASLEPSPIYSTPVFPFDVTVRVELTRSELYYLWGEGSVAPLFLHAAVPTCNIDILNRDECVEVAVRGVMQMPSVATSLYASPVVNSAAGGRGRGAQNSEGNKTANTNCASVNQECGAAAALPSSSKNSPTRMEAADIHVQSSSASANTDSALQQQQLRPSAPIDVTPESHSSSASSGRAHVSATSPMLSAFPDGKEMEEKIEGGDNPSPAAPQGRQQHSSAIEVRATYTADSRPPYRPGSSNDTLSVSLSGTGVPGSDALPGPLHVSLRSPVEVAAWLTFFTFFNPSNTVPLSTSDAVVFSTVATGATDNNNNTTFINEGNTTNGKAQTFPIAEDTVMNKNNSSGNGSDMKTLVRLAPIVFYLPFAGAAAVLWDGAEFSMSLGYNALSIPQLEVLVHEELLDGPTRHGAARASSLNRLCKLRDAGFSVLSLPGTKESSSRGVAAVPGVLLETRQHGPSAADVNRRLVIPALQGQVRQRSSLVQLQRCATLTGVGAVLAARGAQFALLNAVIQRESQHLGLQYACCAASQNKDSGRGSCTIDARAQAQLKPYLSPPMVVLFQNVCCTYEWESRLHQDVCAGLTVAMHNLRCNDYAAYSRAERQRGASFNPAADGIVRSPPLCPSSENAGCYPYSLSIPFLAEVALMDAYVWWTPADAGLFATVSRVNGQQVSGGTSSFRLARNVEDDSDWQEGARRRVRGECGSTPLPSVGTCMPILLYPVCVRTSIVTGAAVPGADPNSGRTVRSNGNRSLGLFTATASRGERNDNSAKKAGTSMGEWSTARSQGSLSNQTPHAASTASFHTMPSTSGDSLATATPLRKSPMFTTTTTETVFAPVFEVSPVNIILNTSTYVVLSEVLLHVQHDQSSEKTTATDAPAQRTASHIYTLERYAVRSLQQEFEASLSALSSPLLSSSCGVRPVQALTPTQDPQKGSLHRDSCSSSSDNHDGRHSSNRSGQNGSPAAKPGTAAIICRYCFDGEQQRLWMEKTELRYTSDRDASSFPHATTTSATTLEQNNDVDDGVTFIPLSSVRTADGLLSSVVSTQLASGTLGPGIPSLLTPFPPQSSLPEAAQDVTQAGPGNQPSLPPPASLHMAAVSSFTFPANEASRLPSRISVTELCIRLVHYQDLESSFTVVGEARDFWQRYAAVHTASRRAVMTPENDLSTSAAADPSASPLLTFLASTVPALRTMVLRSSSWNRGSSAVNPNGQFVSLPGPTELLEENGVDALRIELRGIVVSSFTDAYSIELDACVCASVKSPSRPLLTVTQIELYVPTSNVTYSSITDAARTVACDLEEEEATSAATKCDKERGRCNADVDGTYSLPASRQSNTPTYTAVGASRTTATFSSAGSNCPSRHDKSAVKAYDDVNEGTPQVSSPFPTHMLAEKTEPLGSARAATTAPSETTANARTGNLGSGGRRMSSSFGGTRQVVMMGEVGCRVDSVTVDISATALRAWLSCLVEQPVAALRAAAEEKERWVAFWSAGSSQDNDTDEETVAASNGAASTDNDAVTKKQSETAATVAGPVLAEPQLLLKWKPGRGLRIYKARDAIWSLEHDIILSRNGLVLFFSSFNTNLMTVLLNGYSVILDEALLQQPDGPQRTVMVIEGGLTVRFMGKGRVQLPLGLWNPSLWNSKGSTGVEAALLPFMAIGEGSYLECINVRLGFSEPVRRASAGMEPAMGAAPATAKTTRLQQQQETSSTKFPAQPTPPSATTLQSGAAVEAKKPATRVAAAAAPPLTHRSMHVVLSRVSLIIEPRQETRQVHISTALEIWVSTCSGMLLRDDLHCTGLTISSESIYDTATTTARTAVLAPVDVRVCSNNGRHHAVSFGTAQVDLGRTDLLLLSTYAGEVQAVRSYAKYLTHSRVEKEFMELVEATLAWRTAAPVGPFTREHENDESVTDDDDAVSSDGGSLAHEVAHAGANESSRLKDKRESPQDRLKDVTDTQDLVPLQRDLKVNGSRQGDESPEFGADELLFTPVDADALPLPQPPRAARQESGQLVTTAAASPVADPSAATWDSVASRRSGKGECNTTVSTEAARGKAQASTSPANIDHCNTTTVDTTHSRKKQENGQQQQLRQVQEEEQKQKQRTRRRQRGSKQPHARDISWAVFTPAIELTFSDHRYPLLQFCVQDTMLRRTSTSTWASTLLMRCQKASVRVYGRGRWDAFLLPSAAVTWSLTQSVSRHSSNRHTLLNVEGIHVQCSHLIVAKLLYVTRQLRTLSLGLQRRFAAAASMEVSERRTPAAVDLSAPVNSNNGVDGGNTELPFLPISNVLNAVADSSSSDDGEESGDEHDERSGGSRSDEDTSTSGSMASSRQRPFLSRKHTPTTAAVPAISTTTSNNTHGEADKELAPLSPIIDHSCTEYVPPSRFTWAGALLAAAATAPGGTSSAPVTTSMATHRLFNSFGYTLFAGICEHETVNAVEEAPALSQVITPDSISGKEKRTTQSSTVEAASKIWRCKELYRLPPASATDIFISYRRARSLVLTFFPTGCVDWDECAGMWVLNAKGETDLAAKAAGGMRGPVTTTEPQQRQQPQSSKMNTTHSQAELETDAATHVASSNWFPFTMLQYGVALPVTVRTSPHVMGAARTTNPPSPRGSNNENRSSGYSFGACVTNARTRALDVASGNEFNSYRGQTHALALTCVDPEEEAESLRYPIVVAPSEENIHYERERRRRVQARTISATLQCPSSTPPLCRASSGYVDSAVDEIGHNTDSQMHETQRTCSGCSIDFIADPQHHSRSRKHQQQQFSRVSSPTSAFSAGGLAHLSPMHRHKHMSYVDGIHHQYNSSYYNNNNNTRHSVASQIARQSSSHTTAANTAAAVGAAAEGGDGDLLVVRLQARCSLLNETGCTLQLRSLTPAASASNDTTEDADHVTASASTELVTVPPGWRLPLEEEDVYNEVLLRVCCPSARWVSETTTTAPNVTSNNSAVDDEDESAESGEDKESSSDVVSGAGGSGVFSSALANRWYETRLVLGNLDSGRFLSLSRVRHSAREPRPSSAAAGTADSPTVQTGAVADAGTFVDEDRRPLILFVVINYSSDNLIEHISLYPRLTLVNHLGVKVRVAVFQQDPAAGPQTPDEAMLLAPWTAPYVGRRRHERERFHRSLVALGAHDALPHQHALPLHFCTYSSNLVLGLSFSQSTGDTLMTADLDPVVTHLREAVDHHPRMLLLHDSHGRTFYVQVSVMPRTVVLSVALWVYNLTEYPLLLCDSIITRRLCPGQSSTTGIIPSQGEPFLIGCRLADFTQGFFAIGLDGGWSGAVPIDVGSTGVFVSAQSQLGVQRSCNYSILFPNAQEGRPVVLQITPRWVFYNNTQRRLRIYFRFPGLGKAMQEAEKKRRQLQMQQVEGQASNTATFSTLVASAETTGSLGGAAAPAVSSRLNPILRQADDNVSTLTSLATVRLNPGEYHVSCIGPIEGNQFCVQDVLEGVLPSITSITKDNKVEHRDVAAYYESHLTPYMNVDRPGEATFNLWASPRAPGKRVAVSYGGDLLVQRPVFPHPTWLEPYDVYTTDAVITGRIAVEVQNTENVLTVLLRPIQGTKILLQNRTAHDTVMVRQQGSRRRNRIPPRQNRFFLWEDARQEHRIRVHILGFKGRWFDVDFSSGECQVTYHEDREAAAEAEALAEAQLAHPWPTNIKSDAAPHTPFSFFVRGYPNLEKTRVTIVVTESAIPLYASIDSWRTSAVLSLQVSMVQLSWIQEMSAGVTAAISPTAPFGAAAAGLDGGDDSAAAGGTSNNDGNESDAGGRVTVVDASDVRNGGGKSSHLARRNVNGNEFATSGGAEGSSRLTALSGPRDSVTRRRGRGIAGFAMSLTSLNTNRSGSVYGGGSDAFPGGISSFTSAPLLFSVILEGLQLERLSTEDTETFFFAVHQMQWIDEKLGTVFVYRAHPRLPPLAAATKNNSTSGAAVLASSKSVVKGGGHANVVAAASPFSSPDASMLRRAVPTAGGAGSGGGNSRHIAPSLHSFTRRGRAAMLLPKAAVAAAATANRVLNTVFGQSDAFLLAMEKQNDVELSYNYIKYADGVTRFTELRYVLTPLVVVLTDFWLVDTIQEARRLRVLLGLRKQAAATQTTTTTTVPMMMTLTGPTPLRQEAPLPPPLQPLPVPAPPAVKDSTADAEGTVVTVLVPGERVSSSTMQRMTGAFSRLTSQFPRRTDSDVVIEAENDSAAVSPPLLSPTVVTTSNTTITTTSTAKAATKGCPPPLPSTASTRQADVESSRRKNGPLQGPLQDFTHGYNSSRSTSSSNMEIATVSTQGSTQQHTYTVIRRSPRVPPPPPMGLRNVNRGCNCSDVADVSNDTASQRSARSPVTALSTPSPHVPSPTATTTPPHTATSPASAADTTVTAVEAVAAAVKNSLKPTSGRSRTKRSASQQQRQQQGQPSTVATNTTGFVSQSVFLLQLVQGVRVRLQQQGTGVVADSLAAVTTTSEGGKRGGNGGRSGGLVNPLRSVGGFVGTVGLGGHRPQFGSTTVRHHRGALQRGGAGDGLAGAAATGTAATTTNADGVNNAVGTGSTAAVNGVVDASNLGALTTTTAAAVTTNSSVNTASFMFIERLEVHRVTLYVTFNRHRPDPLRPLLGAYAWMLPSQLNQREFYLPAWTLTQQIETAASLRARLIKWGMHSLREQWTKVTKLGTLLDALQFWQHRTVPLHGAPQKLTLARVQLQRQACDGRPILFAPCVSSGEDGEAAEEEDEEEKSIVTAASRRSEHKLAQMHQLSP